MWAKKLLLKEVIAAINKGCENDGAAGPSTIRFHELREDPHAALRTLQTCIDGCEIPEGMSWLEMCYVPKPTSRPDDPTTFRTIGLEDALLKVLMMVIAARMQRWLAETCQVPKSQFGFIDGRSHEDNTFILRCMIDRARAENRAMIVTFLDIRKAFDSVSRERLWTSLHKMGASGPLFDILREVYASTSGYVVASDGITSVEMDQGVLQGDPLSPLLWAVLFARFKMANTSHKVTLGGIDISKLEFADDLLLASMTPRGGSTGRKGLRELRKAHLAKINAFRQFCEREGLGVAVAKSYSLLLLPPGASRQDFRPIYLQQDRQSEQVVIPNEQKARYLGMLFEPTYTRRFRAEIKLRCDNAVLATAKLAGTEKYFGDMTAQNLLQYYNAVICPTLLQNAAVSFDAPGDALERTQRKCLKMLFRQHPNFPSFVLFYDLGVQPIQAKRLQRALRLYDRAAGADAPKLVRAALLDNHNVASTLLQSCWLQSLAKTLPKSVALNRILPRKRHVPSGLAKSRKDRMARGNKEVEQNITLDALRVFFKDKLPKPANGDRSYLPCYDRSALQWTGKPMPYFTSAGTTFRQVMRIRGARIKTREVMNNWKNATIHDISCRFCNQAPLETLEHLILECTALPDLANAQHPLFSTLADMQMREDGTHITELSLEEIWEEIAWSKDVTLLTSLAATVNAIEKLLK